MTEDRRCKLEERSTEFIEYEQQRENRLKEKKTTKDL